MAVKNPATSCRIGLGYDIHRTKLPANGGATSVVLGGIEIAAPFSLDGHSDADVLLHAITDAILGALADHDIGHYFPPGDEKNRNRKSADFLVFALGRMRSAGYEIANLDCNLICEQPKIAPVRHQLRGAVADLLGVSIDRVSIKGRTNEKLDAAGRGEAIMCQAIVLLNEIR